MALLRLAVAASLALLTTAPAAASWGWGHHDYPPRGGPRTYPAGSPVPEPSDLVLFALGVAGVIAGRWRGRR